MSDSIHRAEGTEPSTVQGTVIRMLEEITAEWDVGPITIGTRLGNLGLESINLVYLIAELQKQYRLQNLIFQKLIAAKIHVNDLQVADLVGYIENGIREEGRPS